MSQDQEGELKNSLYLFVINEAFENRSHWP